MKIERVLASILFAALLAAPAGATKLKVSHVDVDFHTDKLTWHVKAKTCSKDSSDSGTVLYELRLYQLAEPISAGIPHNTVAKWTDDPLHPKGCQTEDLPVTIDLGSVSADEYHVVLWVGDDSGSGRAGKNRYTHSKTYIKQ